MEQIDHRCVGCGVVDTLYPDEAQFVEWLGGDYLCIDCEPHRCDRCGRFDVRLYGTSNVQCCRRCAGDNDYVEWYTNRLARLLPYT